MAGVPFTLRSFALRRSRGIPRDWYSRDYYLSDRCEGFREFVADGALSTVKERLFDRVTPSAGDRVLELGCGRGELLRACARHGASAVGIDYSTDAVKIAAETCGSAASVLQADATGLPFCDRSFTKVFLGDVLEHLTTRQAEHMLAEGHRVLRPGGMLVLHTSPNVLFVRLIFPWVLIGCVATARFSLFRLFVHHYGVMRKLHVREYSAGRLRRLFRTSPFASFRVECDADVLRGGRSRYTEALAANRIVRAVASFVSRDPLNRVFSNDLWVEARKGT
jgi:ubiquinone/menaquinone biosynthesis C-methylase UbiE